MPEMVACSELLPSHGSSYIHEPSLDQTCVSRADTSHKRTTFGQTDSRSSVTKMDLSRTHGPTALAAFPLRHVPLRLVRVAWASSVRSVTSSVVASHRYGGRVQRRLKKVKHIQSTGWAFAALLEDGRWSERFREASTSHDWPGRSWGSIGPYRIHCHRTSGSVPLDPPASKGKSVSTHHHTSEGGSGSIGVFLKGIYW